MVKAGMVLDPPFLALPIARRPTLRLVGLIEGTA